ncbi:MAG TPA: DUF4255 domain-containing protein [Actinomycetota bacterium]
MSNFLAIATVTAALQRILQEQLDEDVPGAKATVDRPGAKPAGTVTDPGVGVYLYRTSPSPAFRAYDVPTRRRDGSLMTRPQIGLDLDYLLTFYGDEGKLEPQRILGSVVRTLHARPGITDADVEAVKAAAAPPLPTLPVHAALKDTDLAGQVEHIVVRPATLDLEELSKLWSVFFQTPYQLSMAYQVSVVLIEESAAPKPARPVLRRGLVAGPVRAPRIESVRAFPDAAEPITIGSTLSIAGTDLAGDVTLVRMFGADVAAAAARPDEVRVAIGAAPAADVRAGEQPLAVVPQRLLGDPPSPHTTEISPMATFVLHPVVQAASLTGPSSARRVRAEMDVTIDRRQSVALLLLQPGTGVQRFLFAGPERDADGDVMQIPVAGVPAGTYVVQVLVDGAESVPQTDANGDPTGPTVTFP